MKYLLSFILLFVSGCTSVTVRPLDASKEIRNVCVQENPKVEVGDFLGVLRDGFDRHGISTKVVGVPAPASCTTLLTYTALRGWDFVPYLRHAELRLEQDGRIIATAEYHLNGRGGLAPIKWASTKSKMDPVIDELLQDYK